MTESQAYEKELRFLQDQLKQKYQNISSDCLVNTGSCLPNGIQKLEEYQKKLISHSRDIQILLDILPSKLTDEQHIALTHIVNRLNCLS